MSDKDRLKIYAGPENEGPNFQGRKILKMQDWQMKDRKCRGEKCRTIITELSQTIMQNYYV